MSSQQKSLGAILDSLQAIGESQEQFERGAEEFFKELADNLWGGAPPSGAIRLFRGFLNPLVRHDDSDEEVAKWLQERWGR